MENLPLHLSPPQNLYHLRHLQLPSLEKAHPHGLLQPLVLRPLLVELQLPLQLVELQLGVEAWQAGVPL